MKEIVFQQKLLEKAYFNVEMTGPAMVRPWSGQATQFWRLESAFSTIQFQACPPTSGICGAFVM